MGGSERATSVPDPKHLGRKGILQLGMDAFAFFMAFDKGSWVKSPSWSQKSLSLLVFCALISPRLCQQAGQNDYPLAPRITTV
jgi:hypothetical protein